MLITGRLWGPIGSVTCPGVFVFPEGWHFCLCLGNSSHLLQPWLTWAEKCKRTQVISLRPVCTPAPRFSRPLVAELWSLTAFLILQWTWPSADSLFSFPKGGAQVQVLGFPLACKSQSAFRLGCQSVSASLSASTQLGERCSRTHSHASHIPPPPPREITGGEDLSTISCAALGARISCFFLQRKHPNFFFSIQWKPRLPQRFLVRWWLC